MVGAMMQKAVIHGLAMGRLCPPGRRGTLDTCRNRVVRSGSLEWGPLFILPGVTLAGPSVNLHGGGAPGNGSGASPEPPLPPRTVAAPDAAVAASPAPSAVLNASSRQAQALRLARDSASAFVEKCPD